MALPYIEPSGGPAPAGENKMDTKINRKSRDGQHIIEFSLSTDLYGGYVIIASRLDGKIQGSWQLSADLLRDEAKAEKMGGVCGLGGSLMLAEERAQLLAWGEQMQIEIDAHPNIILKRAMETRDALICGINGELDRVQVARERGYDEDLGNIPSYDSSAYRAAVAALAAYDAAHPKIIAKIKSDKAEAITRFMAAD